MSRKADQPTVLRGVTPTTRTPLPPAAGTTTFMRCRSNPVNDGAAAAVHVRPFADVAISTSLAAAPDPSPQPSPGSTSKWSTSIVAGSTIVIVFGPGPSVDHAVPSCWSTAASDPQPSPAYSSPPLTVAPPDCAAQLRRSALSSVVVWPATTVTGVSTRSWPGAVTIRFT